jgi:hypothetical protein
MAFLAYQPVMDTIHLCPVAGISDGATTIAH